MQIHIRLLQKKQTKTMQTVMTVRKNLWQTLFGARAITTLMIKFLSRPSEKSELRIQQHCGVNCSAVL